MTGICTAGNADEARELLAFLSPVMEYRQKTEPPLAARLRGHTGDYLICLKVLDKVGQKHGKTDSGRKAADSADKKAPGKAASQYSAEPARIVIAPSSPRLSMPERLAMTRPSWQREPAS